MTNAGKGLVARHSPLVRVIHWATALSGFALLFSGFGQLPMYGRYNVVKIPGLGWSGDYEITLVIHYVAAVVFSAAIFFHIVFHVRRCELAAMPKRGDIAASYRTVVAMLLGRNEPPAEKFLPEQRVAYAAMGAVALLLIVTGAIKSFKNLGPIIIEPTTLQVVTLIHTASAMLFMLLVLAHVAAFVIKANRPLLPSMFTGTVDRAYAEHRHPLWRFSVPDAESAPVETVQEETRPVAEAGTASPREPVTPHVTRKTESSSSSAQAAPHLSEEAESSAPNSQVTWRPAEANRSAQDAPRLTEEAESSTELASDEATSRGNGRRSD